jgi:hypothetical protein
MGVSMGKCVGGKISQSTRYYLSDDFIFWHDLKVGIMCSFENRKETYKI